MCFCFCSSMCDVLLLGGIEFGSMFFGCGFFGGVLFVFVGLNVIIFAWYLNVVVMM